MVFRLPGIYHREILLGRWLVIALILLLGDCAPLIALADLPDTIDRVKPSIVAIVAYKATGSPQYSIRGTGFVVEGSLIVTNAHVVNSITSDSEASLSVQVRLSASESQFRPAQLVSVDGDHDLALLRVRGGGLPPLTLGDSDGVREGQQIAFSGFPIGGVLGFVTVTHHGIVSAITPIVTPAGNSRGLNEQSIQRVRAGPFRVLQLDAVAYPGNSGSPVFDATNGQVLGVINMVFVKGSKEAALSQPSGITYAIPVSFVKALLSGAAK